jgi:hypothetical protein
MFTSSDGATPTTNRRTDMTTTNTSTIPAITVGTRVRIEKGCKARGVNKGVSAKISAIEPMGADYGHCVKVALYLLNGFKSGKTVVFFARHANRLNDAVVNMNDGNPSHTIAVRRS